MTPFQFLGSISIHALREEGDYSDWTRPSTSKQFLSTPSARRATHKSLHSGRLQVISIHALREEGDLKSITLTVRQAGFLSTPSARRAT